MTKRNKKPSQSAEVRRAERRDKIRAAMVALRLQGYEPPTKFPTNIGLLYLNYRKPT